ncbi:MAG: hypothetical protein H6Q72_971 [Firmicutes bacterium]|nr:hypothetical protein [Bacillota bacterium]
MATSRCFICRSKNDTETGYCTNSKCPRYKATETTTETTTTETTETTTTA